MPEGRGGRLSTATLRGRCHTEGRELANAVERIPPKFCTADRGGFTRLRCRSARNDNSLFIAAAGCSAAHFRANTVRPYSASYIIHTQKQHPDGCCFHILLRFQFLQFRINGGDFRFQLLAFGACEQALEGGNLGLQLLLLRVQLVDFC